jgi:hypothetical protein
MIEYVETQWFLGILHRCQNQSAATGSTVLHSGTTYFTFYIYFFLIIQHQTLLSKSTGINYICILGYESFIDTMNQYCVVGLQQFIITRDLSTNFCDQNPFGNSRYV